MADYRPKTYVDHKMKKQPGEEVIELRTNKRYFTGAWKKKEEQLLVGFAAETDHIEEYAQKKLGQNAI